MNKNERRARQKLSGISQDHIFKYWNELDEQHKSQLVEQIEHIDLPAFRWQQEVLKKGSAADGIIEPLTDLVACGQTEHVDLGRRLLNQGKVGCLIVAGGQGTRLKIEGPKGTYPITPIKKKSLFQLFAEKTIAAGKQAGKMLQLAVMTSPHNHQETIRFFFENGNFGLSSLQLSFFCQGTLPLLDSEGDLFLEDKHIIAEGPDGNGSSLKGFVESGIWDKWKRAGIEYVNFVQIDNPLADPYDANLVGLHSAKNCKATIKCIRRDDPEENVGILVKRKESIEIVEYTEISAQERIARAPDGLLKFLCANISAFCFGIDFIQEAASLTTKMPLHLASKAVCAVDEQGVKSIPAQPNAWKFERFIFDVLPMADSVAAVVYPREQVFAPLKNGQGKDSPKTVQQALQNSDRAVFEAVTGQKAPLTTFELSQDFYYPTPELYKKWKEQALPQADYYEMST